MWQVVLDGAPAAVVHRGHAGRRGGRRGDPAVASDPQARPGPSTRSQLRVRIADEAPSVIGGRAENASAGMFELLSGLVAAEEGARGQLAAELHDTVAQSLTHRAG